MNPNRSRSLLFRAVALIAAALLSGCQTFRPVVPNALKRGDRIQVHLQEMRDVPLRLVTARDVTWLNGEFVDTKAGDLVMSAFSTHRADGGIVPAEGWTVRLPLSDVSSLQQKKLAIGRTVGLLAGIVVGAAVLWKTTVGGAAQGSGSGGGGVAQ